MAKDPQAAYRDETQLFSTTINYNGIPTIQRITEPALQQASGIMIWALNYDSADDRSLLNAIYPTVQESPNHQANPAGASAGNSLQD